MLSRVLPTTPQMHAGTLLFSSSYRSVPCHPTSQLSPITAASTQVPRSASVSCLGNPERDLI